MSKETVYMWMGRAHVRVYMCACVWGVVVEEEEQGEAKEVEKEKSEEERGWF